MALLVALGVIALYAILVGAEATRDGEAHHRRLGQQSVRTLRTDDASDVEVIMGGQRWKARGTNR